MSTPEQTATELQALIDAAEPGGTVELPPGNHVVAPPDPAQTCATFAQQDGDPLINVVDPAVLLVRDKSLRIVGNRTRLHVEHGGGIGILAYRCPRIEVSGVEFSHGGGFSLDPQIGMRFLPQFSLMAPIEEPMPLAAVRCGFVHFHHNVVRGGWWRGLFAARCALTIFNHNDLDGTAYYSGIFGPAPDVLIPGYLDVRYETLGRQLGLIERNRASNGVFSLLFGSHGVRVADNVTSNCWGNSVVQTWPNPTIFKTVAHISNEGGGLEVVGNTMMQTFAPTNTTVVGVIPQTPGIWLQNGMIQDHALIKDNFIDGMHSAVSVSAVRGTRIIDNIIPTYRQCALKVVGRKIGTTEYPIIDLEMRGNRIGLMDPASLAPDNTFARRAPIFVKAFDGVRATDVVVADNKYRVSDGPVTFPLPTGYDPILEGLTDPIITGNRRIAW